MVAVRVSVPWYPHTRMPVCRIPPLALVVARRQTEPVPIVVESFRPDSEGRLTVDGGDGGWVASQTGVRPRSPRPAGSD